MLIRQVELPVSDAVQAARFYGDVLGLPTRTGGGVVQVGVGPSVLLLRPGPVEPGPITAPSPSPKTALLRQRRGCKSAFHFWSGTG
jgi:catechol 2,3-dioxygenase-like lactoylglutathione lyase family enzyme